MKFLLIRYEQKPPFFGESERYSTKTAFLLRFLAPIIDVRPRLCLVQNVFAFFFTVIEQRAYVYSRFSALKVYNDILGVRATRSLEDSFSLGPLNAIENVLIYFRF